MSGTAGKDAIPILALQRDQQALDLRLAGCTYDQISERLAFGGRANARRAVQRRIDEMRRDCMETVAEVKQMEISRIDAMLLGVWTRARRGDDKAIASVLRLMERRASYEGLDAPKQTEHMGTVTINRETNEQLLARLDALADRGEAGEADPKPEPE